LGNLEEGSYTGDFERGGLPSWEPLGDDRKGSGDGHLSYGGSGGSNGQPGAGSSARDFEMWS
jgi:hypothetical protein